MVSLASVLRQAESWDEAGAVLEEALDIQEAGPTPNPVDVAFTLALLGDVRSAGGRHTEGVALINRARTMQIEALGPVHVQVAQSENYLVSAYERVDSLTQAIRWQESVVATLESALGAEHPQTASERERLSALRGASPEG